MLAKNTKAAVAILALMTVKLVATIVAEPLDDTHSVAPSKIKDIKAYCIDFNWGPGGPNGFAEPRLWAEADPAKHVAWYKNGKVPEQPGLKHDFLPEMVRLGHKEGLLVMGYFCIGSNTRWGQKHPDY